MHLLYLKYRRSDPRLQNQTGPCEEGGSGQRLRPCGPGSHVASCSRLGLQAVSWMLGLLGVPVCPWEAGTVQSRVAAAGCRQAVRP